MDTRDGRIYEENIINEMNQEDRKYMKPMNHYPTPIQRASRLIKRNDNCPCGSGKKFKKCCLWKDNK